MFTRTDHDERYAPPGNTYDGVGVLIKPSLGNVDVTLDFTHWLHGDIEETLTFTPKEATSIGKALIQAARKSNHGSDTDSDRGAKPDDRKHMDAT